MPKALAARIRKKHDAAEEGWGRLKVTAHIGRSKWDTAIWFDRKAGSYLLPLKAAIRKGESLKEKDTVKVILKVQKTDSRLSRLKSPKLKSSKSQPSQWVTTEDVLLAGLNEDLIEAFQKLKAFAVSLGEQRIYAAGKAIMFAKKVCYFFVRPKKSYLETVIFLSESEKRPDFHSAKAVSKSKFAHTFKLVHADQVEGELTDAVHEAFRR